MRTFINYLNEAGMSDTTKQYVEMLKQHGYTNLKPLNKSWTQFAVLTNDNRIDTLHNIAKILSAKYFPPTPKTVKKSSVGYVETDTHVYIYAKPAAKQGRASAGVENEDVLVNTINRVCAMGPINIRFIDSHGKKFECLMVKHAKCVGGDTKNRKKADVVLQGARDYPFSLKQDNAQNWESGDKLFRDMANKKIDEIIKKKLADISEMPNAKGVYKITPNVYWKASPSEVKDVVFGTDILGKGAVLCKTFSKDLYKIADDGFMEIPVTTIIETVGDIKGQYTPVFLLRNDSTRSGLKFPGLRCLCVTKSRITSKVKEI